MVKKYEHHEQFGVEYWYFGTIFVHIEEILIKFEIFHDFC